MRCRVCGGSMQRRITDLPFKLGDKSIVIIKDLPVLQCTQCNEIELDHPEMERVEALLSSVDQTTELEVLRYAA